MPATWYAGPSFLKKLRCDWIVHETEDLIPDSDPEVYREQINLSCEAVRVLDHPLDMLVKHFSSFYRLKKAVAWLLRCRDSLLKRNVDGGVLTTSEMNYAERLLIKHVQHETYSSEIASLTSKCNVSKASSIRNLNPVLHDDVIVVGGRQTFSRNYTQVPYHFAIQPPIK